MCVCVCVCVCVCGLIPSSVPHTHNNTDLIKYTATPPKESQRRILTDYFNNYNFSKLK